MKKNIIIEDGLTLYKQTGIGRYALLLKELCEDLGYNVILKRKPFLERIKNPTIKRILYNVWLNTIFIIQILFTDANMIFFPNTMTPLFKISNKKYYPVLHDLWSHKYPETMSKVKRDYQNFITKIIKNTAFKIITVSNTVKQEIDELYNCDNNFVVVLHSYFSFGETPNTIYSEQEERMILSKYNISSKAYILSVGSLNKRKNMQMLIDAYNNAKIEEKLVIVGEKENLLYNNLSKNIEFTGYIEEESLKVLYKHAKLYVFPSIYEGMGLPTIDAQSFDIPVLCSDIPVFREIGKDSVEYSELTSHAFSKKIKYILSNNSIREQLIQMGRINITRFNKDKLKIMLENILEV